MYFESTCHPGTLVGFYFGNPWRSVAFVGMYFEDLVFNLRPIEGVNGYVFLQLRIIEHFNRDVIVKLHPIEHFNDGVIVKLRPIEHLNGYVFTE